MRRLVLVLALASFAVAGTAAAFLVMSRREVTTSSPEAYRLYKLGRENEMKIYSREAIAAFAEALSHDGHFVMATLCLAGQLNSRDPERAKCLVQSAARYRDDITKREQLLLRMYEASLVTHDEDALQKAVDEYSRDFPKDPEGFRQRASLLVKKGKTAEAIAEYERVLAVEPNNAFAYNTLGYYWMERGDFAKAEDYLKRYRFLAPDQANPFDSLGELYANTGRYDEAVENLRKALAIKSDFYHSQAMLGTVEVGRGNHREAFAAFRKAAEMTESPSLRFEIELAAAFSLEMNGEARAALDHYEKVVGELRSASLAEKPENAFRDHLVHAAFLGFAGRLDEADAEHQEAAVLKDKIPQSSPSSKEDRERGLLRVKGLLARFHGRDEEAVVALQKVLEDAKASPNGFGFFPNLTFLRMIYARSLDSVGRHAEAEEALKPIFVRNPHFQPALALAQTLGKKQEAPAVASNGRP